MSEERKSDWHSRLDKLTERIDKMTEGLDSLSIYTFADWADSRKVKDEMHAVGNEVHEMSEESKKIIKDESGA